MERMIGLGCFCIALGMFFMFFIQMKFFAVMIIIVLMLIGYNLFSK